MEDKSLIMKLTSKYIIKHIFTYIEDEDIVYNIFRYSKYFHETLDLNIKKYYILTKEIYWDKYLNYLFNLPNTNLNKKYSELLDTYKLDDNEIQEFIVKFYNKILKNDEKNDLYENKKLISFDSPFFNAISKAGLLEKLFDIEIPKNVKYCSESYINSLRDKIDNLNKSNIKYSSLFFVGEPQFDANFYRKNLNIHFNHIKSLNINTYLFDINKFFYDNMENNLVYLKLFIENQIEIDSNRFDKINGFKSLKYLYLKNMRFISPLILKINDLVVASFSFCKNILFENNIFMKLEKIYLSEFSVNKSLKQNYLMKCPQLKSCTLLNQLYSRNDEENYIKYNLILDISSFKNLKKFNGSPEYFILLENDSLEDLYLTNENYNSKIEKKILEKLCSIKTIKKFNLELYNINSEEMSNIKGENTSLISMKLNWHSHNDCILYSLQKNFPNITKLELNILNDLSYPLYKNNKSTIEIIENPNYNLNDIKLDCNLINNISVKFYCNSFEKITSIDFHIIGAEMNIIDYFPIFNDKCNVIFTSLKSFKINHIRDKNFIILINLCKNIDKMPNLKLIDLEYFPNAYVPKNIFKQLLSKIVSLKFIENMSIKINEEGVKCDWYLQGELEQIFPDINFIKLKSSSVRKIKKVKVKNDDKNCIII